MQNCESEIQCFDMNFIFVQNSEVLSTYKRLAGDTAIYGISSILGRVLNWLLTPYYTRVLLESEFGVQTNLYSYAAILLVILTYGMETSFFRFASKSENPGRVYSTSLISVFSTSLLFLLIFIFLTEVKVYCIFDINRRMLREDKF